MSTCQPYIIQKKDFNSKIKSLLLQTERSLMNHNIYTPRAVAVTVLIGVSHP